MCFFVSKFQIGTDLFFCVFFVLIKTFLFSKCIGFCLYFYTQLSCSFKQSKYLMYYILFISSIFLNKTNSRSFSSFFFYILKQQWGIFVLFFRCTTLRMNDILFIFLLLRKTFVIWWILVYLFSFQSFQISTFSSFQFWWSLVFLSILVFPSYQVWTWISLFLTTWS